MVEMTAQAAAVSSFCPPNGRSDCAGRRHFSLIKQMAGMTASNEVFFL
jgi:hypothetical protein